MRRKCPSELNSRTIRIGIGDYALLMELSRRANVTVGEALHQVIGQQPMDVIVQKSVFMNGLAYIPVAQIPLLVAEKHTPKLVLME